MEYSYKEVLFSQKSDYQMVEIVDTEDFGRILVLDGINNFSEVDKIGYTHALLNTPHENYQAKG